MAVVEDVVEGVLWGSTVGITGIVGVVGLV
jgi:hypothetical protein